MGTGSEIGSALKKKKAGEAVSVFKSGWGSLQWLPNSGTHTLTDHAMHNTHTHKHKHCHALMHRFKHAQAVNSRLPQTCELTHLHTHTHSCSGI